MHTCGDPSTSTKHPWPLPDAEPSFFTRRHSAPRGAPAVHMAGALAPPCNIAAVVEPSPPKRKNWSLQTPSSFAQSTPKCQRCPPKKLRSRQPKSCPRHFNKCDRHNHAKWATTQHKTSNSWQQHSKAPCHTSTKPKVAKHFQGCEAPLTNKQMQPHNWLHPIPPRLPFQGCQPRTMHDRQLTATQHDIANAQSPLKPCATQPPANSWSVATEQKIPDTSKHGKRPLPTNWDNWPKVSGTFQAPMQLCSAPNTRSPSTNKSATHASFVAFDPRKQNKREHAQQWEATDQNTPGQPPQKPPTSSLPRCCSTVWCPLQEQNSAASASKTSA